MLLAAILISQGTFTWIQLVMTELASGANLLLASVATVSLLAVGVLAIAWHGGGFRCTEVKKRYDGFPVAGEDVYQQHLRWKYFNVNSQDFRVFVDHLSRISYHVNLGQNVDGLMILFLVYV